MNSDRGSSDKSVSGITPSLELTKRPMSATRRLQNRTAQKAYRDRKRERLRELERKLATLQSATTTVSPAPRPDGTLFPFPNIQTPTQEPAEFYRPGSSFQTVLSEPLPNLVHEPQQWEDISLWLDPMQSDTPAIPVGLGHSNVVMSEVNFTEEDFGLLDSGTYHSSADIQSSSKPPATAQFLQSQHTTSRQPTVHVEATSGNTIPDPGRSKTIHIYRPSGKPFSAMAQVVRKNFLSLPKATQRRLHDLAKDADFSFVDIVQSLLQVTSDNLHEPRPSEQLLPVIQSSMEPNAYSPYRNTLRIARFSYFTALFANFSSLGFEFSSFLDENSISPFYGRPNGDTNDNQIPVSLRPLPTQRTISHHPYIDSLPFPSFRRRALAALSTDPPLLDEDDLCIDLMLNDGLVCWGSANTNGGDYGTPWDSHSWEAKEWFLQKWWWLVGGQDGELFTPPGGGRRSAARKSLCRSCRTTLLASSPSSMCSIFVGVCCSLYLTRHL